MNQETLQLQAAGIAAYEDSRQFHIRFLEGNKARVRRFAQLQRDVLCIPYGAEVAFVASLFSFELIPLSELSKSLQGLNQEEGVTEWIDSKGRLQRRLLSTFTIARLKSLDGNAKAIEVQSLICWLKESTTYRSFTPTDLANEVELDCIAWGARNVPIALWSHLCGLQPMASLPLLGFQRYMGLPIPTVASSGIDTEDDNTGTVLADMLDDLRSKEPDEGRSVDIRNSVNLIDQVIQIFKKRNISNIRTNDIAFVKELLFIRSVVSTMSPQLVWVICWMLDLFESGTPQKPDATFETRARYCRVASEPLLRGLIASGDDFPNFDSEELEAMCLTVMADPTITDKQGLGAAISSFLIFIHEEFDAPLVRPHLHKFITDIVPRAQYVSLAEVQRARGWIHDQQGADVRLKKMASLVLALGYSAPFRRDELLNLRIRNVQKLCSGVGYEIEVNGKLKTQSSTRRVQVVEQWVSVLLDEWMNMRQHEGASSSDLFFGSLDLPKKVYRRSACNRLLLRVLKLSTGDDCMTFHALRHSWATRNIEAIFQSSSIVSFDRLAHIAYLMGHASAQMTLRFYFHTFEVALKHSMDLIQKSTELTSKEASCITGIKQNTLIQRALRTRTSITDVVSALLSKDKNGAGTNPTVVSTSSIPVLLRSFSPELVPLQVDRILNLLREEKLDDEHISGRSNLAASDIRRIRRVGVDLAFKLISSSKKLTELEKQAFSVSEALELTKIRLEAGQKVKFSSLRDYFRLPVDIQLAAAACQSWMSVYSHGHLDASDEVHLAKLLRLLKAAEVNPLNLMLRIEVPGLNKAQIALALGPAIRTFTNVFGRAPHCEELKYVHPARPQVTLVWTSLSEGWPMTAPASVSCTGLNALMFSLSVFTSLVQGAPNAVT
jgi:integrase